MAVIVRSLQAGDQQEWRRLWTAYLAFYNSTVAEPVYAATFSRLLDPARSQQNALVAELAGELVGLVHFIYHPHNWRLDDVCYLQDLYVAPQARNAGIGRALIEAVYAAADDNGTPVVYWLTQDFNTNARALYDQLAQVTPFIKYQRP